MSELPDRVAGARDEWKTAF
ncbi:unnamed protein product [Tuber melanosporum]|uniref:(Perigord truffle) hypothetical protein n=1 Tax=Tuber melanosporum (strain Mel28) TaxID=656061 RepID=D5G5G6_TUBMM|nr:unnamed protein product [Tuber melanosporum]